jgi:hypothetical protein
MPVHAYGARRFTHVAGKTELVAGSHMIAAGCPVARRALPTAEACYNDLHHGWRSQVTLSHSGWQRLNLDIVTDRQ